MAMHDGEAAHGCPALPGPQAWRDIFQWSEHQRERRAELVTHIAKERGLGPIKFSQDLGAATLLLLRTHVRERR